MLFNILTLIVAGFFSLLGGYAISKPERILAPFGVRKLSIDGVNEVRAVYGGFSMAVALVLAATLKIESIKNGARFGVAAALIGMAAGRVVSAIIDRSFGRYPRIFLVTEIVLAAMLLISQ